MEKTIFSLDFISNGVILIHLINRILLSFDLFQKKQQWILPCLPTAINTVKQGNHFLFIGGNEKMLRAYQLLTHRKEIS